MSPVLLIPKITVSKLRSRPRLTQARFLGMLGLNIYVYKMTKFYVT